MKTILLLSLLGISTATGSDKKENDVKAPPALIGGLTKYINEHHSRDAQHTDSNDVGTPAFNSNSNTNNRRHSFQKDSPTLESSSSQGSHYSVLSETTDTSGGSPRMDAHPSITYNDPVKNSRKKRFPFRIFRTKTRENSNEANGRSLTPPRSSSSTNMKSIAASYKELPRNRVGSFTPSTKNDFRNSMYADVSRTPVGNLSPSSPSSSKITRIEPPQHTAQGLKYGSEQSRIKRLLTGNKDTKSVSIVPQFFANAEEETSKMIEAYETKNIPNLEKEFDYKDIITKLEDCRQAYNLMNTRFVDLKSLDWKLCEADPEFLRDPETHISLKTAFFKQKECKYAAKSLYAMKFAQQSSNIEAQSLLCNNLETIHHSLLQTCFNNNNLAERYIDMIYSCHSKQGLFEAQEGASAKTSCNVLTKRANSLLTPLNSRLLEIGKAYFEASPGNGKAEARSPSPNSDVNGNFQALLNHFYIQPQKDVFIKFQNRIREDAGDLLGVYKYMNMKRCDLDIGKATKTFRTIFDLSFAVAPKIHGDWEQGLN